MRAVIPQFGIKTFTRALACLSKYSDDVTISASATKLTLSSVNSSKSAYGRIVFYSGFFDSYDVPVAASQIRQDSDDEATESPNVMEGDVLVKPMLGILRHKTVGDTVNKCELIIHEGSTDVDGDTNASISTMLLLRLHCKYGIIKTHRLYLNESALAMSPRIPKSSEPSQSKIVVGPQVVKDLLDHFNGIAKIDAQLEWRFEQVCVSVKTIDRAMRKRQDAHIATEITVDADDFDVYSVHDPPISLCFHLREFNATTALADSISLPLNIVLTEPGKPIAMEIQTDEQEALFLISTIPADPSAPSTAKGSGKVVMAGMKRKRVGEADIEQPRIPPASRDAMTQNGLPSRPTQRSATNRSSQPPSQPLSISNSPLFVEGRNEDGIDFDFDLNDPFNSDGSFQPQDASIRPPPRLQSQSHPSVAEIHRQHRQPPSNTQGRTSPIRRPLFLEPSQGEPSTSQRAKPPPLSQLPAADVQRIADAGLGIENMDQDEFDALMDAVNAEEEDDDLYCDIGAPDFKPGEKVTRVPAVHEQMETDDDEDTFPATQMPMQSQVVRIASRNGKQFQPLFD